MKVLFIINPYSGHLNPEKAVKIVEKITRFIREDIRFSFVTPAFHVISSRNDLPQIVEKVISENVQRVIICGGDGTVNSFLPFIRQYGIETGILPAGSGNGFAHALNIPDNFKRALEIALTQKTIYVDLLEVNKFIGVNVSGCGLDGLIAHKFNKLRRRGFFPYIYLTISCLFKFNPFNAKVIIDGRKAFEGSALIIAICNGNEYGNGFKISPASPLDDGIFTVVVIPYPSIKNAITSINAIAGKELFRIKGTHIFEGVSCEIETTYPFWHIDGEPHIFHSPVKVGIIKNALPFVCNIT